MNYTDAKEYLASIGQEHLLEYYDELSDSERSLLLSDIEKTDFSIVGNIKRHTAAKRGKITPIDAISLKEIEKNRAEYEAEGLRILAEGKVAAILLAGGQGTRLGFDKPKGMFNIGITRFLPIFALSMNNLKEVAERVNRYFPLFIMTSHLNNKDTVEFFAENNYFGYPKEKIYFFIQDEAPACSLDGKVYLDSKYRVSLAPNGNGGWYSSLKSCGLYEVLEKEGIEWINLYGVDNVLQRMCDPVFVGATALKGSNCGAKVVKKTSPEENVGVMCNEDGKPSVIEYYEMDNKMRYESVDGELKYCYGMTLNYLFNVRALNKVPDGKLPYHLATKAIAHMENGERVTPDHPCGYKFETLVVDMVKLMGTGIAFEVERKREFAPVKNKHGVDSVDTAREMLKDNGIIL